MRVFTTIFILLVLGTAGVLLFIYSGIYNIAATEEHWPPVEWAFHTLMEKSVRAHAEEFETPPEENAERGFRHFDQICVTCHGAPGISPSAIGIGLNPKAPDLTTKISHWQPGELFWLIRHGIKMTGMPGFGLTHGNKDISALVAFLRKLPEISPAEYQRLQQTVPGNQQPEPEQLPPPRPEDYQSETGLAPRWETGRSI